MIPKDPDSIKHILDQPDVDWEALVLIMGEPEVPTLEQEEYDAEREAILHSLGRRDNFLE